MKKIFKKTVWIAICSMAICLLTSCGKEKPQEKKIKDDHIEYETTKENGTTYEDEEAQTAEIQEGDIQNSKNKNDTDMAEEPFDWNALPIAKESDFECVTWVRKKLLKCPLPLPEIRLLKYPIMLLRKKLT